MLPLSPKPLPRFLIQQTPALDDRPRTSSSNRFNEIETRNKAICTLPSDIHIKKDFIIKTSRDRKTHEKRVVTPAKKNLQNLFKKIDEEEEKDFLDLLGQLK
jgi:hypothetical protein